MLIYKQVGRGERLLMLSVMMGPLSSLEEGTMVFCRSDRIGKGMGTMLATSLCPLLSLLLLLLPKYGALRGLGEVHFKFISVHVETVFLRFDVLHLRCDVEDAHAVAYAYAFLPCADEDGVVSECRYAAYFAAAN